MVRVTKRMKRTTIDPQILTCCIAIGVTDISVQQTSVLQTRVNNLFSLSFIAAFERFRHHYRVDSTVFINLRFTTDRS